MGKSTISKQFKLLGFPLFDADAAVHDLYGRGGRAVDLIAEAFPGIIHNMHLCYLLICPPVGPFYRIYVCEELSPTVNINIILTFIIGSVVDGSVDRQILGNMVLSSPDSLSRLENIIHPLVAEEREFFYAIASEQHALAVVYDVPLLYEKNMQGCVDVVVVVTASAATQRARVLSREGASVERFESILSKQLPDEIKRERADYVINTDFKGFVEGRAQLSRVIENLIERHPDHYESWKRNYGLSREPQQPEKGKLRITLYI